MRAPQDGSVAAVLRASSAQISKRARARCDGGCAWHYLRKQRSAAAATPPGSDTRQPRRNVQPACSRSAHLKKSKGDDARGRVRGWSESPDATEHVRASSSACEPAHLDNAQESDMRWRLRRWLPSTRVLFVVAAALRCVCFVLLARHALRRVRAERQLRYRRGATKHVLTSAHAGRARERTCTGPARAGCAVADTWQPRTVRALRSEK
jgi:hypothetical protein